MPDKPNNALDMLLLEPVPLLRRTVSLTARSMGVLRVHEAASAALALRLLKERRFDGAVIALDMQAGGDLAGLGLLEQVRAGGTASPPGIPIAVMIDQCDAAMLSALRARGVTRVLLKPFRARNLLDTFAQLAETAAPANSAAPKALFGVRAD